MRETVILRDRHCVFPWCGVDARSCDQDHIDPYVPIDAGGPPGQTAPSNLACLCRRHHNAKTSRRWRYRRNRDGTYTWHGPYGASYLVTSTGTARLA
jgi:5-methylcytosine-specific restriction endonuclease McrA